MKKGIGPIGKTPEEWMAECVRDNPKRECVECGRMLPKDKKFYCGLDCLEVGEGMK